jgi:sarcosine oxidase subunit gamma
MRDSIDISVLSGWTLLRLKTWLPEYKTGGKPMALDGRELPGPSRMLAVAPGEWLIVAPQIEAPNWRQQVEMDLRDKGFVLVDFTGGLATLVLRGSASREVLSKGCGLDFHPRIFPSGQCARARLAQLPIVIECRDDPEHFELHVARSYLPFLHAWLTDAAADHLAR